jgi:hypothetical protein
MNFKFSFNVCFFLIYSLISIEAKSQDFAAKVNSIKSVKLTGSSAWGTGCTTWQSINIEKIQYFINNSQKIKEPEPEHESENRDEGQAREFCTATVETLLSNKKTITISVNSNGDGVIKGEKYRCQTCAWLMEPTFLKPLPIPSKKITYDSVNIIQASSNDPCPDLAFDENRAKYFIKNSKPLKALDFPKNSTHNKCEGLVHLSIGGKYFEMMVFSDKPEHGLVFMHDESGDNTPYFLKCENCKEIFSKNWVAPKSK